MKNLVLAVQKTVQQWTYRSYPRPTALCAYLPTYFSQLPGRIINFPWTFPQNPGRLDGGRNPWTVGGYVVVE